MAPWLEAWWVWAIAGLALGGASAFFAMLSLSAGTAYGTEYHNLSLRQRSMAKVLYLGALVLSIACGLLGLSLAGWALKLLFAPG